MVGERNIVETVLGVFGIEGAPAAILALHAQNPPRGTLDGATMATRIGSVQRHDDDGGVVHIRVVVVFVLERPAARR